MSFADCSIKIASEFLRKGSKGAAKLPPRVEKSTLLETRTTASFRGFQSCLAFELHARLSL